MNKVKEILKLVEFFAGANATVSEHEEFYKKTLEGIFKAITEDERWPKKYKSNLVCGEFDLAITKCESVLAEILGVKE